MGNVHNSNLLTKPNHMPTVCKPVDRHRKTSVEAKTKYNNKLNRPLRFKQSKLVSRFDISLLCDPMSKCAYKQNAPICFRIGLR